MTEESITVQELAAWREAGRDFVLLDVRELWEVKCAAIGGYVHIPMTDLHHRIGELDPARDTAVLCHSGHRSDVAADFLRRRGFANVRNVEGGIDRYAAVVDPSIPRY